MRVGIVSTSFPLLPGGSSGWFIHQLVEALVAAGHQVTVAVPDDDAGDSTQEQDVGWKVWRIRYAPQRWQRLAHRAGGIPVSLKREPWLWLLVPVFLVTLFAVCVRLGRRSDVLHANWAMVGVIAGIAGRLTGTPVVTTLRGSDTLHLHRSRSGRLTVAVCLRLSSRVIGVSDAISDQLISRWPRLAGRIGVAYNGVDQKFLKVPLLQLHTGPLRLGFVGSLIPRKGLTVLFNALSLLSPGKVTLRIVGTGPDQSALLNRAEELGIAGWLDWRGSVVPAAVPDEMAQMDVLVLPSYGEGRPNVVLEAMAAGRAVIASRIDGLRELIQAPRHGLLVEPGDSRALVDAIRTFQERETTLECGRRARQWIIEQGLTWQGAAKSYDQIYTAVITAEEGQDL